MRSLIHKIPYSKHCLHWIQISCHSQSQSHSHISGSAYFSSVIGALSTAFTWHIHYSSHYHCWSMMWSMQHSSNCQFLMRNATHWPRLKCSKFDFGWSSAPDPTGRAYSTPQPRPPSSIWRDLLLREGRGDLSGNVAEQGFCLKSAPGNRITFNCFHLTYER